MLYQDLYKNMFETSSTDIVKLPYGLKSLYLSAIINEILEDSFSVVSEDLNESKISLVERLWNDFINLVHHGIIDDFYLGISSVNDIIKIRCTYVNNHKENFLVIQHFSYNRGIL